VCTTTQDWLWLKLCLLEDQLGGEAEGDREVAGRGLEQLQRLILRYGPDHFNSKSRNPLLYFQVLLMTQQFERAVDYLVGVEEYQVEAVHMALTLYYYGALLTPESHHLQSETFFEEDRQGRGRLNVVRLIRQYIQPFSLSEPLLALHYCYLVRDAEQQQTCMRELLLRTRDFETLVGGLGEGGERRDGLLHKFIRDPSTLRRILELAAIECENQGQYLDAITLFDLSGNYDKVLSILSSELSQVLTQRGPERERVVALALSINKRYTNAQLGILPRIHDRSLLHTFRLLINLLSFFQYYQDNHLREALLQIESTGMIPFDLGQVSEKVEAFRYLHEVIRRNFGEILLATMALLYALYNQLKKAQPLRGVNLVSATGDQARDQEMDALRSKARAVVTFAGRIQYKMPGDINSRLLRYEVLMS
jgi:nuclear pore complex protein Nup93